jgi:hypothetical protein
VERDAIDMELIWVGGEAKYFCEEIWTGQITLNAFRKFVFARKAFRTHLTLFWKNPACRGKAPKPQRRYCSGALATKQSRFFQVKLLR